MPMNSMNPVIQCSQGDYPEEPAHPTKAEMIGPDSPE